MTKPNITIHDGATGETVEREMTDEEYETYLASQGQGTPIPEEETPEE